MDRDNTLIHDPGYLRHAEHVRLLPGAGEAIAKLRNAGFPVVVVTNQSGIARGYLTEAELAKVHQRMQELLQSSGSGVDAIYYCPFLTGPDAVVDEYRKDSDLRKPKPGMLVQAANELKLDLASSWMIGDSERDIQAGQAVGCKTILIGNGNIDFEAPPDFTAAGFAKAADIVLRETVYKPGAKSGSASKSNETKVTPSVSRKQQPPAKGKPETPSGGGGAAVAVAPAPVRVADAQVRILEPAAAAAHRNVVDPQAPIAPSKHEAGRTSVAGQKSATRAGDREATVQPEVLPESAAPAQTVARSAPELVAKPARPSEAPAKSESNDHGGGSAITPREVPPSRPQPSIESSARSAPSPAAPAPIVAEAKQEVAPRAEAPTKWADVSEEPGSQAPVSPQRSQTQTPPPESKKPVGVVDPAPSRAQAEKPASQEKSAGAQASPPAETAESSTAVRPPASSGPSLSDLPFTTAPETTLGQVLEEVRMLKRERNSSDFSFAQLGGAIVQAFAICAVAFGLYAAVSGDTQAATFRIQLAIAFQLMALTGFILSRKP